MKCVVSRKPRRRTFNPSIDLNDRTLEESFEVRFVTTGHSIQGRLVVVVHTDRDDTIRLISVRTATPSERRTYEKEDQS